MDIGFIGVGNMGAGMANNLLKAGYTLTINDVRRDAAGPLLEKGAKWAETAQQVATQSEISAETREYLLMAAMAGHIAAGNRDAGLKAWQAHGERARSAATAAFRLLRCHARVADCARDFGAQAR